MSASTILTSRDTATDVNAKNELIAAPVNAQNIELLELYLPVNPEQMRWCREGRMRRIQTELPSQPFLFLKLNRKHAEAAARHDVARRYGTAYVLRLRIDTQFLNQCERSSIAYDEHTEYKIPQHRTASLHWHLQSPAEVMSVYWDEKYQESVELIGFL